MKKRIANIALALTLALALLVPASALELEDARQLLREHYVDEIPDEILSLDSLDAILQALGDPYTFYMTAEQYQQFMQDVDGETLTGGIGVSVQTVVDDGVLISSIIPDSPALEAGLEAGDRIMAVDGVTLEAGMNPAVLIQGEPGTPVVLTIRHADGQVQDYTLVRREVVVPIVTYSLVDGTAYINCVSFGASTAPTIRQAIEEYEDETNVWLLDLRSNPGGLSDAAAGSVGWFAGGADIVFFRDASGGYTCLYTLPNCPDLTDKPLIILTSPYSASASELMSAAVRDLGLGIAVGQRTYGKGVAQNVFDQATSPELFDGDCLKVTSARFYSPDGATNDTIGIIPTLVVSKDNTAAVSKLLTAGEPSLARDHLRLEIAGQTLYIDLSQARDAQYSAAFTELLEALPPAAALYQGYSASTWTAVTPQQLAQDLALPFHSRGFADLENSPYAQAINTLAAYQLLSGYDDGTFRPENDITRAEFCAMVSTALNLRAADRTVFTDVAADAWYADAVSAMAARGFIAGDGDGAFRPDDTITYEEMVTVLSSVAGWASMEGYRLEREGLSPQEYVDYADFSQWARTAARNLGALNALVEGQVPQNNGTRQVAAALLEGLMSSTHLLWK